MFRPYSSIQLPHPIILLTNSSQLTMQFTLPDLLTGCPLKDGTNPYYKEAAAESRAWVNSFNIFNNRKRADFIQGLNELLCSHAYCYAGYEQFRTTCDFVSPNHPSRIASNTDMLIRSMRCLLLMRSATSKVARMLA